MDERRTGFGIIRLSYPVGASLASTAAPASIVLLGTNPSYIQPETFSPFKNMDSSHTTLLRQCVRLHGPKARIRQFLFSGC